MVPRDAACPGGSTGEGAAIVSAHGAEAALAGRDAAIVHAPATAEAFGGWFFRKGELGAGSAMDGCGAGEGLGLLGAETLDAEAEKVADGPAVEAADGAGSHGAALGPTRRHSRGRLCR